MLLKELHREDWVLVWDTLLRSTRLGVGVVSLDFLQPGRLDFGVVSMSLSGNSRRESSFPPNISGE